ncbi:DUF2268 domain-containing putative Zn-dependent protease [Acidovorax sp. SUPP2539]|uniref:DUF2268 domain-containing putative Zn-dependent protease n=1 Tax=Acidovorax sp. SUPP2539 TaxID=2920878 RepID=UPI0023DE639D|nr:DUF2268 domain-containing putative Zn-dependent protease [Acidovorax sp. SUPP2539]GKS89318.1 DUF2268 domain-containing putative Zn-dependent protease [Acidovorax sp. SUPP2539]
MSITFHFPDAANQLTHFQPELRDLLSGAAAEVSAVLAIDRLDVLTYATNAVIPELGVNGYAEGPHLLHMKIDPRNSNLPRCMRTAVPALFAHEVHHCVRGRTVGYGSTLREALISEGLAFHFEAQVFGRIPFYATALSPVESDRMRTRMEPMLDATWYDHASWFFGSAKENIPRHAGYAVGYAIVARHLANHKVTASAASATCATAFFTA